MHRCRLRLHLNFKTDYKENKFHELRFNAPGNINEIDSLYNEGCILNNLVSNETIPRK